MFTLTTTRPVWNQLHSQIKWQKWQLQEHRNHFASFAGIFCVISRKEVLYICTLAAYPTYFSSPHLTLWGGILLKCQHSSQINASSLQNLSSVPAITKKWVNLTHNSELQISEQNCDVSEYLFTHPPNEEKGCASLQMKSASTRLSSLWQMISCWW